MTITQTPYDNDAFLYAWQEVNVTSIILRATFPPKQNTSVTSNEAVAAGIGETMVRVPERDVEEL